MYDLKNGKISRAELDDLFGPPAYVSPYPSDRGAVRRWKHEKRRYEFVQVRKNGGGARERERRRIGGFHTLRAKENHERRTGQA
jgi:hypothetical protein